MIISKIYNLQNINYTSPTRNNIHFYGNSGLKHDVFEKNNNRFDMKVFSPFTDSYCKSEVNIDLDKAQQIVLENTQKNGNEIILNYDPSRTGVLYDKTSGKPFVVNILESSTKDFPFSVGYHFMSKDLKHEYGYVHLFKPEHENDCEEGLSADYPEEGVVGDRIEVLYLRNFDDNKIGGVGKLADKMAVQYCIKNGMEPNIVSYADINSHVAHYKRGKRFITPKKGSDEWNFLKDQYGKTDPNVILRDLIEVADLFEEEVDLTGWGFLMMYMPKELIDKYR